jgi:wyosine [tRNA(Phe)-imidazoG37] synthetase (radical SAM superfamily)
MGINNIPPKVCSYSCVYCQLGRTQDLQMERKSFFGPVRIYQEVERQVAVVEGDDGIIDVLTFVPDGEPTIDGDIGREIDLVRGLGYPVSVITNSSLLFREDVREEVSGADIVSVKVDTVDEAKWKRLNRPHGSLKFQDLLQGVLEFSDVYSKTLITETMLVKGSNDSRDELERTSEFIQGLGPSMSYLSVPIRPPSEVHVKAPDGHVIDEALRIFSSGGLRIAALTEGEVGGFTYTGDLERDILAITSVHPMREDSIKELCVSSGEGWTVIEDMIMKGSIEILEYEGQRFFRKLFKNS